MSLGRSCRRLCGPSGAIDPLRVGCRTAVEFGQVGIDVLPARLGLLDHRGQASGLGLEDLDLVRDPTACVEGEGAPLVRVAGLPELLSIALPRGVVLEQLADLGE